jgi:hypothetical protein
LKARDTVAHAPQLVDDEADGAQRDAAVGDVEGREVPAGVVELQEVDHVAMQQAVDQVADGAAQDAGQRQAEQLLARVRAQHPEDEHGWRHGDAGEQPALPARGRGQERERGAGVVRPDDVEEAGDVVESPSR